MMPLQERLGPNANVAAPAPYRPDKLVRTDHKAQSLDTFLVRQANPSATAAAALGGMVARKRVREQRGVPLEFGGADGGEGGGEGEDDGVGPPQGMRVVRQCRNPTSVCELSSIQVGLLPRFMHTRRRTRACAHTHSCAHARTHTHTHMFALAVPHAHAHTCTGSSHTGASSFYTQPPPPHTHTHTHAHALRPLTHAHTCTGSSHTGASSC